MPVLVGVTMIVVVRLALRVVGDRGVAAVADRRVLVPGLEPGGPGDGVLPGPRAAQAGEHLA